MGNNPENGLARGPAAGALSTPLSVQAAAALDSLLATAPDNALTAKVTITDGDLVRVTVATRLNDTWTLGGFIEQRRKTGSSAFGVGVHIRWGS